MTSKQKWNKKAGIYLRLSKDDERAGESLSIENQRRILEKYVAEQGFTFPVVYDTELDAVNTYGVSGFPCTYFIDAGGNLVARGSGMLTLESLEKGIAMITE